MPKKSRSFNLQVAGIMFNGRFLDNPATASWNSTEESVTFRPANSLYNVLDTQVGQTLEGTFSFATLDPYVASGMLGGSVITSGKHYIQDEAITIAATTMLPTLSGSTQGPLISGTISVVRTDGTGAFSEKPGGTPGVGEFSFLNASSLSFNAGDAAVTAKVTYQAWYTNDLGFKALDTAARPYGILQFITVAANQNNSNVTVFNVHEFPRARCGFPTLDIGLGGGDAPTYKVDFKAVTDGNSAYNFYVVSG